jgi:hypothetical protein
VRGGFADGVRIADAPTIIRTTPVTGGTITTVTPLLARRAPLPNGFWQVFRVPAPQVLRSAGFQVFRVPGFQAP